MNEEVYEALKRVIDKVIDLDLKQVITLTTEEKEDTDLIYSWIDEVAKEYESEEK